MAEIAAQVNNFAFYHSTQSVYCTVEILEVHLFDSNNKFADHFKALTKHQKINLKYTEDNYKNLLANLQDRILRIRITAVETSRDPKQSTKYLIESVAKCAILEAN